MHRNRNEVEEHAGARRVRVQEVQGLERVAMFVDRDLVNARRVALPLLLWSSQSSSADPSGGASPDATDAGTTAHLTSRSSTRSASLRMRSVSATPWGTTRSDPSAQRKTM